MAKFCSVCGSLLNDEKSQFCSNCGGKLPKISSNPQEPAKIFSEIPMTPSSGNKLKEAGKWIAICCGGAILCVVIAAFVYGMTGAAPVSKTPTLSIAEIKSQSQNISYANLMRNSDNYKNSIVHFRGKVMQVQQIYGDTYMLRIATKSEGLFGYFDDIVYVNYNGNRLLEDDIVDLWGNFVGLKSYQAVLGNEITIPEINALDIEIVQAKK